MLTKLPRRGFGRLWRLEAGLPAKEVTAWRSSTSTRRFRLCPSARWA